jgi:hypothetical protein
MDTKRSMKLWKSETYGEFEHQLIQKLKLIFRISSLHSIRLNYTQTNEKRKQNQKNKYLSCIDVVEIYSKIFETKILVFLFRIFIM